MESGHLAIAFYLTSEPERKVGERYEDAYDKLGLNEVEALRYSLFVAAHGAITKSSDDKSDYGRDRQIQQAINRQPPDPRLPAAASAHRAIVS